MQIICPNCQKQTPNGYRCIHCNTSLRRRDDSDDYIPSSPIESYTPSQTYDGSPSPCYDSYDASSSSCD